MERSDLNETVSENIFLTKIMNLSQILFPCHATILFIAALITNAVQLIGLCVGYSIPIVGKYINDVALGLYGWFVVAYFETMSGIVIHASGIEKLQHIALQRRSAVIVCNHVSYADWVILFMIASRLDVVSALRVATKDIVKYVPGIGWATILGGYPIMTRSWKHDEATLQRTCTSYASSHRMGMPVWVCIYPEGTFVDNAEDSVIFNSRTFCTTAGLPEYTHTLCPRTKGTEFIVHTLRSHIPNVDVVDITLRYEQHYDTARNLTDTLRTVPSISNFFTSRLITDVSVEINLVDTTCDGWLYRLFSEKNKQLRVPFKGDPWNHSIDGTQNLTRIVMMWVVIISYCLFAAPYYVRYGLLSIGVIGFVANIILNK